MKGHETQFEVNGWRRWYQAQRQQPGAWTLAEACLWPNLPCFGELQEGWGRACRRFWAPPVLAPGPWLVKTTAPMSGCLSTRACARFTCCAAVHTHRHAKEQSLPRQAPMAMLVSGSDFGYNLRIADKCFSTTECTDQACSCHQSTLPPTLAMGPKERSCRFHSAKMFSTVRTIWRGWKDGLQRLAP